MFVPQLHTGSRPRRKIDNQSGRAKKGGAWLGQVESKLWSEEWRGREGERASCWEERAQRGRRRGNWFGGFADRLRADSGWEEGGWKEGGGGGGGGGRRVTQSSAFVCFPSRLQPKTNQTVTSVITPNTQKWSTNLSWDLIYLWASYEWMRCALEYTNTKRPHGRLQIQSAYSNSVKSESLFTYKQLAQCVSSSSRIAVLAGYTHTGSVPAGYLCLSRINLCLPLFTPPRPTKADGNFFVADLTEKYGAFHRLPSTLNRFWEMMRKWR